MITNPAIDVLQRELEETDRHIADLSESLKSARAKQKSLGEALSVLTGQPSAALTVKAADGGPTLKEHISALLTPDGMGLSPAEIAALLTENGRETGNTTVSSTLSRMKRDGVVVKRGGKWFLPQTDVATQEDSVHEANEPPEGGSKFTEEVAASFKTQNGSQQGIPSAQFPDPSGQTRHWKLPGA